MQNPSMPCRNLRSLNKELPTPLYHQLKAILQEAIEIGVWRPDDQLPTEDELAHHFSVSKMTVRQALGELSTMGYVRRVQGRGTFAARPEVELGSREFTSFTHEMRRHNLHPTTEVLEQSVDEATDAIAAALHIEPGAPVFRLKRLRLADGTPMGIQCAWLPLEIVPGIVNLDFRNASLYDVLETRYGLRPERAHETHFAVLISAADACLLSVEAGAPGLAAERITLLADGRRLEFVESVMRGDRYRIVLDLTASRTMFGPHAQIPGL